MDYRFNRRERLYRMPHEESNFGSQSPRESYEFQRSHEPMSQPDGWGGESLDVLVNREKEISKATNNGSPR